MPLTLAALTGTAVGANEVDLSIPAPSGGVGTIRYTFQRQIAGTWTTVGVAGQTANTLAVYGLAAATAHSFQCLLKDSDTTPSTATSNTVVVTTGSGSSPTTANFDHTAIAAITPPITEGRWTRSDPYFTSAERNACVHFEAFGSDVDLTSYYGWWCQIDGGQWFQIGSAPVGSPVTANVFSGLADGVWHSVWLVQPTGAENNVGWRTTGTVISVRSVAGTPAIRRSIARGPWKYVKATDATISTNLADDTAGFQTGAGFVSPTIGVNWGIDSVDFVANNYGVIVQSYNDGLLMYDVDGTAQPPVAVAAAPFPGCAMRWTFLPYWGNAADLGASQRFRVTVAGGANTAVDKIILVGNGTTAAAFSTATISAPIDVTVEGNSLVATNELAAIPDGDATHGIAYLAAKYLSDTGLEYRPRQYGYNGQNFAYLVSNESTTFGRQSPTLSDIYILTEFGRNDWGADASQVAAMQANVTTLINHRLSTQVKSTGHLIVTTDSAVGRGTLTGSASYVNQAIRQAAAACTDPRLVFLDTATVRDLPTGDGTHYTPAGYALLVFKIVKGYLAALNPVAILRRRIRSYGA